MNNFHFDTPNLVLELQTLDDIQATLSSLFHNANYDDYVRNIVLICGRIMHTHHTSAGHKHHIPVKQQMEDLLYVLLSGSIEKFLPRTDRAYKVAAVMLSKFVASPGKWIL